MILGYQVQSAAGDNWGDRPSYEILTEQTAIADLKAAREKQPSAGYILIAILPGDIEEPTFENELAAYNDQFKALVVSTYHLQPHEHDMLNTLADSPDCNMIAKRNTGWFVKLYDQAQYNTQHEGMSEGFHIILNQALAAGYCMVEFDRDADAHDNFELFE